jgi:2,4-dienoyl-CoA reductase-like NADH-dependent reductase (Old Yellow Enzyme family)
MDNDAIFQPLVFRNLTVKNRLFRSNISGRIDNYDGSGSPARIAWEAKFARGGVGAILSAHSPVTVHGRILPNYAMIDRDERVPFWRMVTDRVHEYDCKYILQLSHGGHQQDIGGVENIKRPPQSSTDKRDFFHGFPTHSMTVPEIEDVVRAFAAAAYRARQAGCDGVELHACNGYLFTQFLSSAINDREDDYGGPLENRARLLLDVIRAVRASVGSDFHLQVKTNGLDYNDALEPWQPEGNTLEESIQVARWVEAAGADALHISVGSYFPHPRNPPGGFSDPNVVRNYDTVLSSGTHTLRNYLAFRYMPTLSRAVWLRTVEGLDPEGISLEECAAIKREVKIPVLSTGGYQHASRIRAAIVEGKCDGVAIARPLMANPDLPLMLARGEETAPKPCTYCNKCLPNVIENPLGCYEESRYPSYDAMIEELLSFYKDSDFVPVPKPDPET